MQISRTPIAIVAVAMVATASFLGLAAADVVENSILSHNGNDVTAPGQPFAVTYWVKSTSNDGSAGCNAADGTPLALTIVPSSPDVVPTPPLLVFTGCGEDHAQDAVLLTFVPGNYRINLAPLDAGSGKYDVNGAEFTLHVVSPDAEGPAILATPPAPTEATSPAGAAVEYGVSAVDPSGVASLSCSPPTGHVFPIGTTVVTCTATDTLGNANVTTFTIRVVDTTPPALHLPGAIAAGAPDLAGAILSYPASASDSASDISSFACTPPSGSAFPLGTTTVVCTATDAAGNTATGSFPITVSDTGAPVLSLPAPAPFEAAGPAGAEVAYEASAWDAVDGGIPIACAPPPGAFPLGATTVTCSATDAAGNTALGSFLVVVQDTTAPALAASDLTLEATSAAGAVAAYDAAAWDLVDGAIAPACAPIDGSTFPLGVSTVACTAIDAAGNAASATFTVTVRDTTPPTLSTSGDQTLEATGPGGASATFWATWTDLVDGDGTAWCDATSGATFALGTTAVSCLAQDLAGNGAATSFAITVVDTTPPALVVPAGIVAEATGPSGAPASWSTSSWDIVDGEIAPICAPESGSAFPLGLTSVTCSATDAAGNAASASFQVLVQDTTPPTLTLPVSLALDATSGSGTYASWAVPGWDIVDGSVAVTCTPGAGDLLPLGTTTISCSATDAAGNTASGSFDVTVWVNCIGPLAPWKADGKTTFRFGSTIPIKCKPTGGSAGVSDAIIRLTMTQVNSASPGGDLVTTSTSAADTGNVMRWDPTGQQYIYNMATKPLAKGTWKLTLDLGGGNLRTVLVGLR